MLDLVKLLSGGTFLCLIGIGPSLSESLTSGEARGLVRSSARVELRTDLVANIKLAPYDAGMKFKKGATLIEFNCVRYRAEYRAAMAGASVARVELRAKKLLVANGAAGKSELLIAKANAAQANAEAIARKARISECTFKAPFSGRVVALNTRKFEMPSAGEPIISIINDSVLELELVVPSKWLTWIKIGQRFQFLVDETGSVHTAMIMRTGAEVDPVSQTIKVFGQLQGDPDAILAGMSGTAKFDGNGS